MPLCDIESNTMLQQMDIAQRITLARKTKGFSQVQLAAMLGVSRGACGQWERGVTAPSVVNLSRLAWVLDVRFEWVATGRGEMLYDACAQETETAHNQSKDFIPVDQKEVMQIYSGLPGKRKSALLAFLRTL
ncbi:MAG: helix-turn-helix domain-containing protein [Mariprofundaceae bacterium]|nr:helix-turn-helix domain-containing protein [Mariprofundaceae bacterium]